MTEQTARLKKQLKFASHLVPLVLSGKKVSTWRLWDEKALAENDVLDFLEFGKTTPFASGVITKTLEKPLGDLTEEDKKGHEQFRSDQEMYETYEKYYGRSVDKDTVVKIIWFKLI